MLAFSHRTANEKEANRRKGNVTNIDRKNGYFTNSSPPLKQARMASGRIYLIFAVDIHFAKVSVVSQFVGFFAPNE